MTMPLEGNPAHDEGRSRNLLRTARAAGVLYLVIIVCGVWSDGFVRSQLVVSGDAVQTAANLLGSSDLFRMSFVADSLMVLCDVALAVLLFVLLEPVGRTFAALATAFRLVQASVLGLNLLNQHVALQWLTASTSGSALDPSARAALALRFAEAQASGYDIGLLFFGISCVLTGALLARSRLVPHMIGLLLATSGPVYLAGSYLALLDASAASSFEVAYLLPLIAETSLCLWLLIKRVDLRAYASA